MNFSNIFSYIITGWIAHVVAFFSLLLVIIFWRVYVRRNNALRGEIEGIKKEVIYNRKQFDAHFKVTDETVVDVRAERDRERKEKEKWMAIALKEGIKTS